MRTVGVTGGIASGKSAVCRLLAPYPVIEADQVARDMVAPGSEGLAQVVEAFGQDILQADGHLDRRAMRNRIAQSTEAQQKLNQLLHPLIRKSIAQQIEDLARTGETIAFVSAALMLETGSYKHYQGVLLVTCPESIRLQRLVQRDGMDETAAKNLMAKQWPDEKKTPFATAIIANDSDFNALKSRTWTALKTMSIPLPKGAD